MTANGVKSGTAAFAAFSTVLKDIASPPRLLVDINKAMDWGQLLLIRSKQSYGICGSKRAVRPLKSAF